MKSTDTKAVVATLVELVTFLFAAFNGYLTTIAPPGSRVGGMDGPAAVGFASFAALLIFLLFKVWMRGISVDHPRFRRTWMTVTSLLTVAYVVIGFAYERSLSAHTFFYPLGDVAGNTEVIGDRFTSTGKQKFEQFRESAGRDPMAAELIKLGGGELGGSIVTFWTPSSTRAAHDALVRWYVALVVVLATAIASLIELLLAGQGPTIPSPQHDGASSGNSPSASASNGASPPARPPLKPTRRKPPSPYRWLRRARQVKRGHKEGHPTKALSDAAIELRSPHGTR